MNLINLMATVVGKRGAFTIEDISGPQTNIFHRIYFGCDSIKETFQEQLYSIHNALWGSGLRNLGSH